MLSLTLLTLLPSAEVAPTALTPSTDKTLAGLATKLDALTHENDELKRVLSGRAEDTSLTAQVVPPAFTDSNTCSTSADCQGDTGCAAWAFRRSGVAGLNVYSCVPCPDGASGAYKFKPGSCPLCKDKLSSNACTKKKAAGKCSKHAVFTHQCMRTCGTCAYVCMDRIGTAMCQTKKSKCYRNSIMNQCQKTCGACPPATTTLALASTEAQEDEDADGEDEDSEDEDEEPMLPILSNATTETA
jgi:hypothetical protein